MGEFRLNCSILKYTFTHHSSAVICLLFSKLNLFFMRKIPPPWKNFPTQPRIFFAVISYKDPYYLLKDL